MSLTQELRASLSFSYAFVRPYSVSLAAVFLAQSRNYCAELASETLSEIGAFTTDEIRQIQSAIVHHSDKNATHGPDQLLKAADVLQHHVYNPQLEPHPRHRSRLARVKESSKTSGCTTEEIAWMNKSARVFPESSLPLAIRDCARVSECATLASTST